MYAHWPSHTTQLVHKLSNFKYVRGVMDLYKKLGDRRYHRASGNNEYDCNGDTTQAAQSRDYHQFLTNLATPVFVLATWETGIDLVLNWVQVSRFLTYLIRSKHVLKERVSRPNHENNPKKTRIKK